ncbi:serine hydrolase [Paenibacillus sp. PK4536]|uniref:Gamma-D-glutamyl-meso-diaminopimelate peptidase n=1 Tax=Paenibacillus nuruki TaxID=1886670 RepID=A0A1E3L7B8_9BACL|nr:MULTISPECIES: serine hydrolase [Paenibacillus]ODP29712.1 Gamma-D-glutamyl-meso-diaminopimelate peptidase [Paenibacillus nuruki]WIM37672.1 serine hydrolase [Paenibacillus sp. PK4536]
MTFVKKSNWVSLATKLLIVSALTVSIVPASHIAPKAQAASTEKPAVITIAGKEVAWDTAPFVTKGTTLVPLRQAARELGATAQWDASTRSVVMYSHGDKVVHTPNTNKITLDGYEIEMPEVSRNVYGTMMVPARFLSDSLKANLTVSSTPEVTTINLTPDQSTVYASSARTVDTYLQSQNYSGLALVAYKGKVVMRKGYGLSGGEKATPPDGKSRIASLSKSFTASAVMKLIEDGKVKLTDHLSDYIPDFPRGNEITVHMLLSHTAGFNSNFTRTEGMTLEQTVDEIKTKPLRFEPGERFNYSNQGYVLLAYIIQQVSGESYGEYIQQKFLDPLNMKDTGETTPATKTITGYVKDGDTWDEAGYYVSQSGTGTFYSTLDDMMKWYKSFDNHTILSEDTVNKMFTTYSDLKPYGYAFLIKNVDGKRTIYHNGSGTGYATGFTHNLDDDVLVILLGNHYGMDMQKMLADTQTLANKALVK